MYKLLIVEDEKPLREKMTNNVDWEAHGYSVYQASNGQEALSILGREDINILVTDIQMPKISGMELVKRVRELSDNIKVIIISGHAEFEYAQQSIRLGVHDYLLKPFRSKRLLEVVNKTRDKLLQENESIKQLEELRKEISDYIEENQLNATYNWLTDDDFFEQLSLIMDNNRLYQVLKTGSEQDLIAEIEIILQELDNFSTDRQQLFIFLNNVILFTFRTMKELGYDFEDLMSIIDKDYLQQISREDINKVKDWLKHFFLDVNHLVSFNQDNRNEELIRKMKQYINQHYSEGITLSELARQFNVSNGYLSKLFLEQVGENFTDYLNMIRVNKAKELLKTTDKKIYQVADEVGFNDSYYFSSWFKKIVGVTPTTYRENLDLL